MLIMYYVNNVLSKKFDFIYGQHFKHLKNLEDWLKRRVLISEPDENILKTFTFLNDENKRYLTERKLTSLKYFESFSKPLKHIYQPTGHSCGNTCIKMIYDALEPDNKVTIDELLIWCNTDWLIGTPPERMVLGFEKLGIEYVEKYGFENLKESLKNDKNCIIRTITKNIPHWIVVDGYNKKENSFLILDPWLGVLSYNTQELDNVWSHRKHFYYEI